MYLYENNCGLNVVKTKLPGFSKFAAKIYEYVPFEYLTKAIKHVLLESLFKFKQIAILSDHFLVKSIKAKFFNLPEPLWFTTILPEKFLPDFDNLPTCNLSNFLYEI